MVEEKAFLAKPKHQNHVSQRKKHILVPNHKKKEIIMRNQVLSIWWMNFDFEEYGGNKSFFSKSKASKLSIRWKENVFCAQSQKESRLPWESRLVPFFGWTLILRKTMEVKVFLANPKHKKRTSFSVESQKQ